MSQNNYHKEIFQFVKDFDIKQINQYFQILGQDIKDIQEERNLNSEFKNILISLILKQKYLLQLVYQTIVSFQKKDISNLIKSATFEKVAEIVQNTYTKYTIDENQYKQNILNQQMKENQEKFFKFYFSSLQNCIPEENSFHQELEKNLFVIKSPKNLTNLMMNFLKNNNNSQKDKNQILEFHQKIIEQIQYYIKKGYVLRNQVNFSDIITKNITNKKYFIDKFKQQQYSFCNNNCLSDIKNDFSVYQNNISILSLKNRLVEYFQNFRIFQEFMNEENGEQRNENMRNENMRNENMRNENMRNENMRNENTRNENMRNENMRNENTRIENNYQYDSFQNDEFNQQGQGYLQNSFDKSQLMQSSMDKKVSSVVDLIQNLYQKNLKQINQQNQIKIQEKLSNQVIRELKKNVSQQNFNFNIQNLFKNEPKIHQKYMIQSMEASMNKIINNPKILSLLLQTTDQSLAN